MSSRVFRTSLGLAAVAVFGLAVPCGAATGDFNEDGFVDLTDYYALAVCLDISGPGEEPLFSECLTAFDFDEDDDVDLKDFATFQSSHREHLPIPMKDSLGNLLTVDIATPYSGRQTCGTVGCHDLDDPAGIMNGMKFQQGRTDVAGNVVMKDDYYEDGRWWQRSPGRFGMWSQATTLQMAGKENASESVFDQSAFAWVRDCGGCHPGGGFGEFDRDGELLYNEVTEEFGYEVLGKDPTDVVLDGDYADLHFATGTVSPARWDLTGLAGPDCLFCHRAGRPIESTPYGNIDMIKHWREAALGAGTEMVDDNGDPVQAFTAAATASQGWFSNIEIVQDGFVPKAITLQIDYSVGVQDGSLVEGLDGTVYLDGAALVAPAPDEACWACHGQKRLLNGMVWFDDTPDVHYRYINKLSDDDPDNDIPGDKSTACNYCHPGGLDHNFAWGNDLLFQTRNERDWVNFRSCRDCHLRELPSGDPNPLAHPDAIELTYPIHFQDEVVGNMIDVLSCQACHVPYALGLAIVYFDSSAGGIVWPQMGPAAITMQYYSADPLDPTNPDKSTWYPMLKWKTDSDGVERLFPCIAWPDIHWADWDQNETPEDLSDDILTPIIEWRMYQVIGSEPLPVVTDDDGDGRVEMNRPEEMLAYMALLKGNDSYGRQIAANPVLVKGPGVWYEDPEAPDGVSSFEHEGTGIPVKWYYYIWGQDHNVLPAAEAWGSEGDEWACGHCHLFHNGMQPTKVFDRLILVDPYDVDGQPVYKTVRELTGLDPI